MKKHINKILMGSILFFISLNAFSFVPAIAYGFTATQALKEAIVTAVKNPALIQKAKTAVFGGVESGKVGIGLKGAGIFAGTTAGSALIADGVFSPSTSNTLNVAPGTVIDSTPIYHPDTGEHYYDGRVTYVEENPGEGSCLFERVKLDGTVQKSVGVFPLGSFYEESVYIGSYTCPGASGTFDFSNSTAGDYNLITDSSGNTGYLDSSGNFVPIYMATPAELATAYGDETGQAQNFLNSLWDSVQDKPTEYKGLTYSEALAKANGYTGENRPSLDDYPILPTALNPTGSTDYIDTSGDGSAVVPDVPADVAPVAPSVPRTSTGTTTTNTTINNVDGSVTTSTSTSTTTTTTNEPEVIDYRGYLTGILNNTGKTATHANGIKQLLSQPPEQPPTPDFTDLALNFETEATKQENDFEKDETGIDLDSFTYESNLIPDTPCSNLTVQVTGTNFTINLLHMCIIWQMFSVFLVGFSYLWGFEIIYGAVRG
ncbi:hypothetical protein JCM30760_07760 [Thiomicrorhabdus hydrogeniphila]